LASNTSGGQPDDGLVLDVGEALVRFLRGWLVRVAALAGIRRRGDEIDAEISSHLQLHIDDGLRTGLSPGEARRAALIKLGSVEAVREAYRDQHGVPALSILADACRHGVRALVRHRAFNLVVVAILALGVGSTAAMVGVIDALMFRPPAHVEAPDRLVQVASANNYPQYEALARGSRTLVATAFTRRTLTLGRGDAARAIETQCVTATYFPVLGAQPIVGRAFFPVDDARGAPPTVVLGYGVWRREFAADPRVVGSAVTVAGIEHTVVGVAPPDFRGIEMAAVDAWILLEVSPAVCSLSGRNELQSSSGSWLTVLGRLERHVSLAQAETEVRALALHAIRDRLYSSAAQQLRPIAETRRGRASRDSRLALWLAAGAGLVLLIACANVAGLLSVRAIERRREIAIRLQLGASRGRVFLQLLAENAALAGACVVAAWIVAGAMGNLLRGFFPAVLHDSWFDGRTIGVLAVFGLGACVLAGAVPSAQTARRHAVGLWRSGSSLGQARSRFRNSLLVAQIAFALVLAVGAGLFARSVAAARTGLGYDLDRVIVATLDLDRAGIRRQAEKRLVFDRILQNVRQLPDVESAALTTASPLGSGQSSVVMPSGPPGGPASGAQTLTRHVLTVSPDYFATIGTRIIDGRSFTEADGSTMPGVAIVDAGLAREMWPGDRVIGQCKAFTPAGPCVEIVGVSEPRRIGSLARASGEIFYPLTPGSSSVPQAVLVRTRGSAAGALPAVASAIRSASPNLPFVGARPLADLANVQARSWRLGALLFGLFGAVAVVLAAVGVYASLAFAVRQRTAEIGVRLALGAEPGEIARMVLRQGARLMAIGWLLGLVASLAFGRSIAGLLFGVVPTDPTAFAAASAIVGVAALAGSLLPALRAANVDPVVALRTE
jgi:predicted permease